MIRHLQENFPFYDTKLPKFVDWAAENSFYKNDKSY